MKVNFRKQIAITICLGSLIWGSAALADGWPSSVVGSWSARANRTSGTLSIASQATSGQCRAIVGNIFGDAISGFYCPGSGRIGFVRKSGNIAFQYYSGNVSQNGSTLYLGGTFASWDSGGNDGEYNFYASR